ncbi:MAG: sugar ABC transporter permease [Thermomicrobiales bacterium]|nr:sugar ABC transporter permease [Thermomicrobiales bacterium]
MQQVHEPVADFGLTEPPPRKSGLKWPTAYWYLLPVAISALVFTVGPFFYTFYISFTNYHRVFRVNDYDWVGLDNYKRALSSGGDLYPVLGWTFAFMFITTALNVFGGLILALLLNNKELHERNIYRTLLIIPWALPGILTIQVWSGLFGLSGPFNLILQNMGFDRVRWLMEEQPARFALLVTNFWLSYPFFMTVGLAALQAIPRDLYEVADLDGAGSWQIFRDITWPFMIASVTPLLITQLAFQFNNAGLIILLTNGDPQAYPGSRFGVTDTLASFSYKLINAQGNGDMGYAAAYGVFTFLIIATLMLISSRVTNAFKEVD